MALTPIQGASGFFVGANSTYTNVTPAGVWSSGDTSVLTIDAVTGIALGIANGNTQVIYTLAGNSTAINVAISSTGQITNGFNPTEVLGALGNEILWPSQGVSVSGRYFTEFHPICDETILKSLSVVNNYPSYQDFLTALNQSVILDCVNACYNKAQMIDKSQYVFRRADIILVTQPVPDQSPGQFVGLKLQLAPGDYFI